MIYDEAAIKRRINGRRRDFLLKTVIAMLLILLATLVIIIFPNTTSIFISALVIIFSFVFLFKTMRRYHPKILFKGEITGINIKEHEFVITNMRPTFSARLVMPKANTKSFTGGKTRTKPATGAIVYLRLPDGNVTYIDHLTNAQTDIYEIGDTLHKYSGARFPIILGRKLDSQPCRLCGTANKYIEEKCITCGLEIYK